MWLAPKVPLFRDSSTGYTLIKEYRELVKQNFKFLLYTFPNERMMQPTFGIGIRRFLFEFPSPFLYDKISSAINEQVNRWLPYMKIEDIIYKSAADDEDMDSQMLGITILYRIVPLNITDELEATLRTGDDFSRKALPKDFS